MAPTKKISTAYKEMLSVEKILEKELSNEDFVHVMTILNGKILP